MKKNITTATIALAILTGLTVTSCKKESMVPTESESAAEVTNDGTQSNTNNSVRGHFSSREYYLTMVFRLMVQQHVVIIQIMPYSVNHQQ